MSRELDSRGINRAMAQVYAAGDGAEALRAHIEWLDGQLAERDERITELESELEDLEGQLAQGPASA